MPAARVAEQKSAGPTLRAVLVTMMVIGVFCGLLLPFEKPTFDNRPSGAVEVTGITPEGHLALADGRVVRLFGVSIPADSAVRATFIKSLVSETGNRVVISEVLPGEIPAVSAFGYHDTRGFCGNCRQTWNPFKEARPRYRAYSIASLLIRYGIGDADAADLSDPRADPAIVEEIRRATDARLPERSPPAGAIPKH